MKKVKKNTLVDLNIFDIALVDKGANKKKRFFNIIKSHGGNMNKKVALILMKSESLSKEDKDELLEGLEENVKADVLAQIKKDEDGDKDDSSEDSESNEDSSDSDKSDNSSDSSDSDKSDDDSKEDDSSDEKEVEKAGAVVSKKNKAAIEGAIKALQSILNFGHTDDKDKKPEEKKKSEKQEEDLIEISTEEIAEMVKEEIANL